LMASSPLVRVIVQGQPLREKLIVSPELAAVILSRNEWGPLSSVLITVIVAALAKVAKRMNPEIVKARNVFFIVPAFRHRQILFNDETCGRDIEALSYGDNFTLETGNRVIILCVIRRSLR
jgi:hypothetical protein